MRIANNRYFFVIVLDFILVTFLLMFSTIKEFLRLTLLAHLSENQPTKFNKNETNAYDDNGSITEQYENKTTIQKKEVVVAALQLVDIIASSGKMHAEVLSKSSTPSFLPTLYKPFL